MIFSHTPAAVGLCTLAIELMSVTLGNRELVSNHVLDLLALVRGQHRGEGIELVLAKFAALVALGTVIRDEARVGLLDLIFLLGGQTEFFSDTLEPLGDGLAKLCDRPLVEPAEISADHHDPIREEIRDLLSLIRSQDCIDGLELFLQQVIAFVTEGRDSWLVAAAFQSST